MCPFSDMLRHDFPMWMLTAYGNLSVSFGIPSSSVLYFWAAVLLWITWDWRNGTPRHSYSMLVGGGGFSVGADLLTGLPVTQQSHHMLEVFWHSSCLRHFCVCEVYIKWQMLVPRRMTLCSQVHLWTADQSFHWKIMNFSSRQFLTCVRFCKHCKWSVGFMFWSP